MTLKHQPLVGLVGWRGMVGSVLMDRMQAEGYVATWVAGEQVQREGEITEARPGRLVRMGRT